MAGGRCGHHPRDYRLGGAAGEGWISGEHLIGDDTQGIDVRPRRDLPLAHGLFGRHIVRRAERHAGLGHSPAAGLARGQRDTEVGDQGAALPPQYSYLGTVTAGLDVAKKIEADGADADPTPPKVVHKMVSVTIAES